jgi:signal transduction histidine kinase
MGANFVLQTMGKAGDARSRRILEAMLRSCTQMERLVRNFADLAEIEGGHVDLRVGVHDAGEMLEIVAQTTADHARTRSVAIEINRPDPPVVVSCDRERFLRALGHVVENAIKFAPDGSTVTIEALPAASGVRFEVIDRGIGLSEEVKANLFDRAWHARRASRVGAGFGLAIARGFVVAHGGTLEVTSNPGIETIFSLSLPRNEAKARVSSGHRRRR